VLSAQFFSPETVSEFANPWTELTAYRSNTGALRRHPLSDEIVALGAPASP
jgi:hypothetical protein